LATASEEPSRNSWDDVGAIAANYPGKNLVIKNAGLLGRAGRWNIFIVGGTIVKIVNADVNDVSLIAQDCCVLDASSKLVLPGFVDAHVHLDKCYLLDRCQAIRGDFSEAMSETLAAKKTFSSEDVRNRAKRLIENEISFGTTLMRTHVEVDPIIGFLSLRVILALRKEYENLITIQVAVFAQEGITNQRGQREMIWEALQMGTNCIEILHAFHHYFQ
jgi:cytosine/creatinine deaminase